MNRTTFITIFFIVFINYAATKPILEAEDESPTGNEITTTVEVTEKPSARLSFSEQLNTVQKSLKNNDIPEMRLKRIERKAKLINETANSTNQEGEAPFVSILRQIMSMPNVLEKPALIDENEAPFVSTLLMRILPKMNNSTSMNELKEFVSTLYNSTKNIGINATEKSVISTERTVVELADDKSKRTEDNSTALSLGLDDKIIAEVTTENVNKEIDESLKEKSVQVKNEEKLLQEFEDSIKFLTQSFGGIFPPQQSKQIDDKPGNGNSIKANQLSSNTNSPVDDSSIKDPSSGNFEESGDFSDNCHEDFPYPAATNQESVNLMMKRSEGSSSDNEADDESSNDYDWVIVDKRTEESVKDSLESVEEANLMEALGITIDVRGGNEGEKVGNKSKKGDYMVNDLLGFEPKLKGENEKIDDDDNDVEIVVNNFGNVLFLFGKVGLNETDDVILDTRNQVDVEDDKLLVNDEENEVGVEGFEVLGKEHGRIFELVRDLLNKLN